MKKYYINLKRSPERRAKFDDTWERWEATDYRDLEVDDPIFARMTSIWNTAPKMHQAKSACFLSHYRLLQFIVKNKMNNVLICEDDAVQISPIPEKLGETFTYLGGFFHSLRMTDGPLLCDVPSHRGLNPLDREHHRMMCTLAYHIPRWHIAQSLLNFFDSKARLRAIDVMLFSAPLSFSYYYPAPFVEAGEPSTIRTKKGKHADSHYRLVK